MEQAAATTEDGAEAPTPKKKTRRGTRGGRNRRKKPAAAANGDAETLEDAPAPATTAEESWEYVPMSEWGEQVDDG